MASPTASPCGDEPGSSRIEVLPATPDRFDDVAALLNPKNDPRSCWCLYYRLSSSDYGAVRGEQRRRVVRELLGRETAPGMLAYLDDVPIGWCGMGPRTDMERLQRSRTIPAIDDRPVWSIVCFVVRAGFRRQGVARTLLDGAIEYAKAAGATCLEAYPIDPDGVRITTSAVYVGTTGMFEAADFHRVTKTDSTSGHRPRWLMRRELL